jgi:nucleotidyltransferase/DNA polymerase involved in DNA repair
MSVVPFSQLEKSALLRVKGVGPKVIERLEQMGFSSLHQLADADARDILAQGAKLSGSSCWKNSPQAKAAVEAAISAALAVTDGNTTNRCAR